MVSYRKLITAVILKTLTITCDYHPTLNESLKYLEKQSDSLGL